MADTNSSTLSPRLNLPEHIRACLVAKIDQLLRNPIIFHIEFADSSAEPSSDDPFQRMFAARAAHAPAQGPFVINTESGSCSVAVELDERWEGYEKKVLDDLKSAVDNSVALLDDAMLDCLRRTPRQFLDAKTFEPVTLIDFKTERRGMVDHVIELTFESAPNSTTGVRHVAVIPNLSHLERQLAALETVEKSWNDGPLAPLRALLGLCPAHDLGSPHASPAKAHGKLDDHQRRCTDLALATPHFAVVKGPPGAGKTTLIEQIVVGTIQRGERVLVVSPTHTAVDNVVEKLLKPTGGADTLEPKSLPVRYATRAKRLQHAALPAWVGPRSQRRAGSIAERLERRLAATMPLAGALFPRVDPNADGHAPLSAAIASFEPVICGTPIGLLGYASVRDAAPGAFDLLVIDEVSKMTLPEFLAIAVKAKRWVVVGDPEQLPPHVDAGENAVVLADILDPEMELACSAAMALARRKPKDRRLEPLLLVARHPTRAAHALRQQLVTTGLDRSPRVAAFDELEPARRAQRFYGVLVASPEQVDAACRCLDPEHAGLEMLVEQRLGRDLPSVPGLTRIKREKRVAAGMFEQSFKAYHALPWANRQRLALPGLACIDELEHAMPTDALLEALDRPADAANTRTALAVRYALCAVSVYDWLVGMPIRDFTVSPLRELAVLDDRALQDMVRPFVGVLEKQYRMAPSISVTPRRLFYFNEALHDGAPRGHDYGTVLEQVRSAPSADGKESAEECARIAEILAELETAAALESAAQNKPAHHDVMVITPYCKQRDRLKQMVDSMSFDHLSVAVQTIDTCQGRDADFVLISLVRPKSTPFLDNPKRWNVAFTRAKRGLFVVGDIEAFHLSARRARGGSPRGASPGRQPMVRMSVLERIIEEIDSVTRTLQKAHHA